MRAISVLLALAAATVAQERYALDVRGAPGEGRLTGRQAVTVPQSRWHHGVYETALRDRFEFGRAFCRTIVPKGPVAVGARWRCEPAACSDFARAIVVACRPDPKDPVAWTKWTGSGIDVSRRNAGGRLTATLASVTDGLATIGFEGRIWVAESGRAKNRYGPNRYDVRWLIPVRGTLCITVPEQRVHSFVVRTAAAKARGAYYNQGGRTKRERFEATMEFIAALVPLPDARQAARARALIADLGADDAVLRAIAFRTLAAMPYNITPLLREWRHDPDAEVRRSIVNLLRYRGGRP